MKKEDIKNITIVAHVDHSKVTLVDGLSKTSGIFRGDQDVQDRVMDSNDIEREGGVTILSKNTAIDYKNHKVNIIDTPGHADFGREVERVLKMTSGVVLIVGAFEGPMPRAKFILEKAFELNLPTIICINKIDRKKARVDKVVDGILDLFTQLSADESYLDSLFVYASAGEGFATDNLNERPEDMTVLLGKIIDYTPTPEGEEDVPFRLLISTTNFNDYVGRADISEIERGKVKVNDNCVIVNYNDPDEKEKIKIARIYGFNGLSRAEVNESKFGSIVALTGIKRIEIGDTLANEEDCEPIEFVGISNSTLAVNFSVNNSPFTGRDGKSVANRQVRSRLYKELETDVSLKVEDTGSTDAFRISGRGELHLSVLAENVKHEGLEFQVSKPEVLLKENRDERVLEPIEIVTIDIKEGPVETVIERLDTRKDELQNISNTSNRYMRLIFEIPSRGLIGYRQEFLNDIEGNGVINAELKGCEPYKEEIPKRQLGSLVPYDAGTVTAYGLSAAQDRRILFVQPQDEAYKGIIVGFNVKGLGIEINICRKKVQTNIRSSAADEALKLSPPEIVSLEEMMGFVRESESIEITPHHLRLRKRVLDTQLGYRSEKYNE